MIPVCRRLNPGSHDRHRLPLDSEQVLDDRFRLLVATFSEVVVTDDAIRVDEVESRPVMVTEGSPNLEVVVEGDRIFDAALHDGSSHVFHFMLERELGCMNTRRRRAHPLDRPATRHEPRVRSGAS